MATFQIGAGADDGHCNNAASPVFASNTAWVTMGKAGTVNLYSGFYRFDNVTIPAGSTIDSCKVTFQSIANLSGTTVNYNLHFCAEDDASAPTDVASFNGKSLTSAVAWNSVGAWTTGTNYDTPEIKTILQAVTDRAGWVSGNAVVFMVLNNGSSNNAYRQAKAYETAANVSAILTVTYTAPSTGTNMKVNISDTWKDVSEVKINIGDSWKTVTSAYINIGDTWKTVF